jgi:hypothetical protein
LPASVKSPVDSITISAPSCFHGNAAGPSFTARHLILPVHDQEIVHSLRFGRLSAASPLKGPCGNRASEGKPDCPRGRGR